MTGKNIKKYTSITIRKIWQCEFSRRHKAVLRIIAREARMKNSYNSRSMKKLLGIITFFGGALFGLLFATKSGKEMRQEIAKTKDEEVVSKLGKELLDSGKNFIEAVKDAADKPVKDAIQKGQDRGAEMIKLAKKKVIKLKKDARKQVDKVTKRVKKKVMSKAMVIKKPMSAKKKITVSNKPKARKK